MAVRKNEITRAMLREKHRIENILDNKVFQESVKTLRKVLGIDAVKRKIVGEKVHPICDKDENGERKYNIPEILLAIRELKIQLTRKQFERINKELLALSNQGVNTSFNFMFDSICHDFEGSEHDEFIEYEIETDNPVLVYFYASNNRLELTSTRMEPDRIYIDVTRASLDDVVANWWEVEKCQRDLKIHPIRRGKPKGSKDISKLKRDKRLWEIYISIQKTNQEKGRKNYRTIGGRYKSIYDLVSHVYGDEQRLSRDKYLPPDTVKRVITQMRRKMNSYNNQ
jgi:hypothetical protein